MTTSIEVPEHLAPALAMMIETLSRKGADYSAGEWSSNFGDTASHFGIPRSEACDFNELQKLSRLKSLRTGKTPRNEAVEDTYRDKANYALLAYVLYLEENPPPELVMIGEAKDGSAVNIEGPIEDISRSDLLEEAWGIIANAGWDENAKTSGWDEAATRFRDKYFAWLHETETHEHDESATPGRDIVSTHMPIENDAVHAWLQRIREDFEPGTVGRTSVNTMIRNYRFRAEHGMSLSDPVPEGLA
jgi:hypothetical protein